MRTYLSFGGGVNSVAMYLLLMDGGMVPGDPVGGFEAVYVDHGGDWPETGEYVRMFAERFPLTVLVPEYEGHTNLYDYCWYRRMVPFMRTRFCTSRFKVRPLHRHYERPCFELIGIDAGEAHRARLSSIKSVESRYPLIEREISRQQCVEIIKAHGLAVPRKSGCFFCPFQRLAQWRELRMVHPDLFCKTVQLEQRNREAAQERGKKAYTLHGSGRMVSELVNENQKKLFKEHAYPPCSCGL